MAKRIVREPGSDVVEALEESQIIISRLTTVEVISALERQHREGQLSAEDRSQTLEYLRGLFQRILVSEITASICDRSAELLARHPLRAADAIQLAGALDLAAELGQDMPFVVFDRRLRRAAQMESLEILPERIP